MQPTIICHVPEAGMICLNGRFAGESTPQRPLFAPVAPSGALYLEYRPLEGDRGGLARRLVLSGGAPLPESLERAVGLYCVSWPGGALEIDLVPPDPTVERFTLEGLPCAMTRGEAVTLSLNGIQVTLPEGAGLPRLVRLDDAAALLGDTGDGGRYLAALAPDLSAQTGLLVADAIEPADGGLFSTYAALGDTVGHARLEQWLADRDGLRCVASQSAWATGGPRWPDTAEATMIAAAEAALAGLPGEADGYLSPALAEKKPLAAIADACDLCVPMKYPVPDARPCVGLVRQLNDHLAIVRPLHYRAEPVGGTQGRWMIDEMTVERELLNAFLE